jgi:hypothetical protein
MKKKFSTQPPDDPLCLRSQSSSYNSSVAKNTSLLCHNAYRRTCSIELLLRMCYTAIRQLDSILLYDRCNIIKLTDCLEL